MIIIIMIAFLVSFIVTGSLVIFSKYFGISTNTERKLSVVTALTILAYTVVIAIGGALFGDVVAALIIAGLWIYLTLKVGDDDQDNNEYQLA